MVHHVDWVHRGPRLKCWRSRIYCSEISHRCSVQGPSACGYVPTLTNIYPIYGLNRRGEGTSLLSRLTILKGDGQHRTTKIPVCWCTLGSKPPSQLVVAGPVTRHDELKLLRKVQRTKTPVEGLCLRTVNARTRAWPLSQVSKSPQLCKIPLIGLRRNGYTIACHGKG